MKRNASVVFVGAIALGLAISNVSAQEAQAPAGENKVPKIEFDRLVYDFGTTSLVESVTGTFTYRNTGTGVLKIQRPSTSCGCTVASVKPDVLQPGESGELVFTLRVAGTRGYQEKHITVPSDDPANPSVRLTLKADVKQVVEVVPPHAAIGDIRQGTTTNLTVTIRRTDGKKLEIAKTEAPGTMVRIQGEPKFAENGESAELVLAISGDGSPRRFREEVKIYIPESQTPAVTVPVFGRVLGEIALAPEALFWGITDPERWPEGRPEEVATRQIVVSATSPDKPLEIRNLTSTLTDVQVELVTLETGKTYAVVAKLPTAPKESERGTITFDTNLASQPTVAVPVTINVLKR